MHFETQDEYSDDGNRKTIKNLVRIWNSKCILDIIDRE